MTTQKITLSEATEMLENSRTAYLNIANKEMVLNSKGGIVYSYPKAMFNSAIIYEDSIRLFTLSKSELQSIINLKKEIFSKPLIDNNKFAFQRTHGDKATDFCMMCNNIKNISSKAKAIEI